ncbi:hypothetical protein KP509_39G031800 [Ceratopteris richardii]|uniref:Uncharacterized protein n=1 Tax=Ceratopteris richardii TaxID=49495 RepID=A0A8T2Q089_CERRI|nr:hypothetical protein KP509_39G031800 [Ceratopteris richardii]KAH7277047.1 hypothetical protein KP509_39G031800 [Ceratopteris richardii]
MRQPISKQTQVRNQRRTSMCVCGNDVEISTQKCECDEYRRKTRMQTRRENQIKANTDLEISYVSIQTLHSICAPKRSHLQANKVSSCVTGKQNLHQNKRESVDPCLGPFPSSMQAMVYAFETYSSRQSLLKDAESMIEKEQVESHSQPSKTAAVADPWLEVFVEMEHGIDLVVDLSLNGTADWLLERSSCMFVFSDVSDGDVRGCCPTDSRANNLTDATCPTSDSTAKTSPAEGSLQDNDQRMTCTMVESDSASRGVQFGASTVYASVESQDSITSAMKDLRNEGFNIALLERMPTFLATGKQGP